jgi:hypothetical protein
MENDDSAEIEQKLLAEEEKIRTRIDEHGITWRKIYFGSGPHLQNWLDQTIELFGQENVHTEEVDMPGLSCFKDGQDKLYRIWAKETKSSDMPSLQL